VDAFSYNYRVSVVADGLFDRSVSSQALTLFDLQAKYADVISLDEAVASLGQVHRAQPLTT
jgi:isochorismate hydrolase